MGFLSEHNGVARFAIGQGDELTLILDPERHIVNINNCDFWWLQTASLRELHVQGQAEESYYAGHHQAYLAGLLNELGIETGYAVDIGAHDGRNHSNTYDLFRAGWKGLAAECNPNRFARLAQAYQVLPQVELVRRWITPENVVPLLRAYEVPEQFDFLSLDIDSYDYHVLASLLQAYRPTLISCEVNEALPPPLRFTLHPHQDPDFSRRFYGQSLALLDDLARTHDYALVHMYYMDAFLLDRRYLEGEPPSLAEIFQKGMLDLPIPDHFSDYPFDVQALWQAGPEQAYAMVSQGFAPYAGRFELSLEPLGPAH